MDEQDKNILKLLKENSRYSIRKIAKKLSMRPSTVHQRILRLIRNKVISQFTIVTNDKEVGESFIAFVMAKGELAPELLQHASIKEAFHITGEYNLLLKLKFEDVERFNDFMILFRQKQKDLQATLTMVATQKLKERI